MGTCFTVSRCQRRYDDGISAFDRARRRSLADPKCLQDAFHSPGHIPLIARDGGVLVRAGHTEAAVDLMSWRAGAVRSHLRNP